MGTTYFARAHVITVGDDTSTDWFARAPLADNTAIVARNATEQGEYIWRDAAGDENTALNGGPDPSADIREVRYTGTATNLFALVKVASIPVASGANAPQVQIAIDLDRAPGSGAAGLVQGAETDVADAGRWEYLAQTRFGTGNANVALWQSGVGTPAFVGSADAATNGTIELSIPWSSLGLPGPPTSPLRFTTATFRSTAGDATVDVGGAGVSNALDTVTDYGDPGTAPNTTAELGDQRVDYFADVSFTPAGEVRAPIVASSFVSNFGAPNEAAEWIQVSNPSAVTVNLSGFKLGDAKVPDNGASMYTFPTGTTLAPGGRFLVARSGTAYNTAFGSLPGAEFVDTSPLVPNMDTFTPWGSAALDLDDAGDVVVLLDGSNTTIDAVPYGTGTYTGVNPIAPAPAPGEVHSRALSLRDTDDADADFGPLGCSGTKLWTGAGGNNSWFTAGNWSGGTLPGPADHVCIPDTSHATISFASNLNATVASLTSNEKLTIVNGTLTLDPPTPSTQPSAISALDFNGGLIDGDADVHVAGTFNWNDGELRAPNTTPRLTVGGLTTIATTADHNIRFRRLDLNGGGVWNAGRMLVAEGASIRNAAGQTFVAQSGNTVQHWFGANPAFINEGTFTKAGPGVVSFTSLFHNNGTLGVDAGTLELSGGTSTGAFAIGDATTLRFIGGTQNLNAGSSISGTGVLGFSSGTTNINGSYSHTGPVSLTSSGVAVFAPPLNGNVLSQSGSSSVLSVSSNSSVASYSFTDGIQEGVGDLNVTGALTWGGGEFRAPNNSAKTTVAGQTTISGAVDHNIRFRRLELNGGGSWDAGRILLAEGAVIRNGAGQSFVAQSGNIVQHWFGAGVAFVNDGTLTKAGAGTVTFSSLFHNSGAVNIDAGALQLDGGGNSTGSFAIASGAALRFAGGTSNLNVGSSLAGAGLLHFSAGTTNVNGGYSHTGPISLTSSGVAVFTPPLNGNVLTQSGSGSVLAVNSNSSVASYVFSDGIQDGSGDLNVAGDFAWNGGEFRAPSTAVKTSVVGTTTIGANVDHNIRARRLDMMGGGSWNAGRILLADGATMRNPAGKTFVAQSANNIQWWFGAVPAFINEGVFTKPGAATVGIVSGALFHNSGTTTVDAGIFEIQGGTSSGAFSVPAGSTLQIAGGAQTLTSTSSVGGDGTIRFTSGTTTFGGAYVFGGLTELVGGDAVFNRIDGSDTTPMLTARLRLASTSSTLGGNELLRVGESFAWIAGTQTGSGGETDVTPAAALTITTTNTKTLSGKRTLRSRGSATWTDPGTISMGGGTPSGANFRNEGTLELGDGQSVTHGGGEVEFLNLPGAQIRKIGTPSGQTSNWSAENGAAAADGSAVSSIPGWTRTSNFTVIPYNAPGYPSAPSATAGANFFAGGPNTPVSTISQSFDVSGYAGAIDRGEFSASLDGLLGGAGAKNDAMTVKAIFKNASGAALGEAVIGPVLAAERDNVTGFVAKSATGVAPAGTRSIELRATAQREGITGYNDAYADNIRLRYRDLDSWAGATTIDVPVDNDSSVAGGGIEVRHGTLNLAEGSLPANSSSGSFTTIDGAALQFGGGSYSLGATSVVTGAGAVRFTGGDVTMSGSYDPHATTIAGGTAIVAVPATTELMRLFGGCLCGGSTFTVEEAGTWWGGSMAGSGRTIVPASVTLTLPGQTDDRWLGLRTLENNGTVDFTASDDDLRLYDGAVIENAGTFNFTRDADLDWWSGARPSFNNTGDLIKTAGTGDGVSFIQAFMNNNATGGKRVHVQSGELELHDFGTSGGDFVVAAGARLDNTNGTLTLTPTSSVTGAGTVNASGSGTIVVGGIYDVGTTHINGGRINFDSPSLTDTLAFTSGALGGTNTLTIESAGTWSGGAMDGAGRTLIPAGVTLTMPNQSADRWLTQRTLENKGTVDFTALDDDLRLSDGAVIDNTGTFNITRDADLDWWTGARPSFNNTGDLVKTAGTTDGLSFLQAIMNNNATGGKRVYVQSGELELHDFGTSGGDFVVAGGARLDVPVNTVTLTPTSTLTGAGTVGATGSGTLVVGGVYDVGTTHIAGGRINFDSPSSTDTLAFTSGALGGTNTLTIESGGTWSGGAMDGAGRTLIPAGVTLTMPNQSADRWLGQRTLENRGTVAFTPADDDLRLYDAAVIDNRGTFTISNGADFDWWSGTNPTILNTGTIAKTGAADAFNEAILDNTGGTLDVAAGTFRQIGSLTNFDSGTKTLSGGAYRVAGTLRFPSADIQTNAATIVLDGAASAITDLAGTPADALRAFRTNAAGGDFSIVGGRNLAAIGAPNTLTNNGTLRGTGTYVRAVTNHGTVAPGASPGILTVDGNYTQSPTGTLEIEVGGTTDPGTLYDRLVVTGTASLDGTLTALLFGGFVPVTGVGIDVVTAASRTGTFNVVDSVPMPMPGDLLPEARYDETSATLFAVPGGGAADDSVSEGAGTKSITVTLSAASNEEVRVQYATANGSADAGDYTSTSGELIFPAGHTSKSFDVAITDDARDEPDQTFLVNLSSAANSVLTDTQATITIADNDALPSISVADHQQAEGNFGPNDFTVPLTLSAVSEKTVTVAYATAEDDGTAENDATSGVDFTAKAGTVTFEPGETTDSVAISIAGDVNVEFDEDFFVDLTLPVNATIGKPRAIVAILDDDQGTAASKLSIADVAVTEIDGVGRTAVFTVSLTPMSPTPVSVTATAVDGSATGGSDFSSTSELLVFAPSETSKQFVVPITGDNLDEATETFGVTLTGAIDGAIDDGFALGTITDDDDTPALVTEAIVIADEDQAAPEPFTLVADDGDDDPLNFAVVRQPDHGNVVDAPAPGTDEVLYTPNPNFNGFDTFTVQVSDGTNASTGTYQIQVAALNDAPVVLGESRDVQEDGFADIDVLANDTDVDGDVLALQSVGAAAHGNVEQLPDGRTLRYRPAANYHGPDSFLYTVRDGAGGLVNGTVTLQVLAVNDAPVANDNPVTVVEDSGTTIVSVLLNDTDAEGHSLTVTGVGSALHGTTAFTAGSVSYTPIPNYNGADTFSYTVSDGNGGTAVGNVNVTVTPVNDAPVASDAAATLFEDSPQTVTLPATDVDGNPLTYSIVTGPGQGTLSPISGNQVTYFPDLDAFGFDSFTFRASDGTAFSNEAIVSLTIEPVNDMPVALDDSGTVAEDASFADIPALHNDSDVDPQGLSFDSVGTPVHGTAVPRGDGTVRYTPDPNYNGPDSFSYTMTDGAGGFSTATVHVTVTPVNDQPVALGKTAAVAQGIGETIELEAIDVDGDALTYSIVSGPSKGTLSAPSGNAVTYTANADATGEDTFTFAASDGTASSDPATVTISISAGGGATSQISIDNVSVTEGDLGLSTLTFTVNRTLAGSGAASVQYSTVGGSAIEGVDYVGESGTLNFATGDATEQVTIDVVGDRLDEGNESVLVTLSGASGAGLLDGQGLGTITDDDESPVAAGQSVATTEDTPKPIVLGANDADGDNLAFTIVDGPAHGALSGSGADRMYTPAANYHGPDSFTFKVSDGANESNLATVSIALTAVNDAPVATAVARAFAEDSAETIPLPATDADGDPLTYSTSDVLGGNVSINGNEATFTPTLNYHGPASFTFRATDSAGAASNQATASLTITPVNDAPAAAADSLTVAEDGGFTVVDVVANDVDVDGDAITVTAVSDPPNGTVESGPVRYRPDPNHAGSDAFTYALSDGQGGQATGHVTVTVTPVNDVPVAESQSAVTVANRPLTVTLRASDVDDSALTYAVTTQPTSGAVSLAGAQATYTPDTGFTGTDSFSFTASDGVATSAPAVVNLEVVAAGSAPTASMANQPGISEADDEVVFTLTSPGAATIRLSTDDVTTEAEAGEDYIGATTTFTFPASGGSRQFAVKLIDDAVDEHEETFRVAIEVLSGGVTAPDFATGTIVDDDPLVELGAGAVNVNESNAGSHVVNVPVSLNKASAKTVQVSYATVNGSAIAGEDFLATSGGLTFEPGQTTKSVAVTILGDTAVEVDETLMVELTSVEHAAVSGGGSISILNDDSLIPLPPPPPPPPPAPVTPTADLAIAVSAPETSAVDRSATYSVTVRNTGPDAATGVIVRDVLPGGLQFVSASAGQIACVPGATIACPVGAVASGGSATVTIVATTVEPGVHTNTVTVSGDQADPNAGNNSASATTRVPVPVDRQPQERRDGCTQRGTAGADVLRGGPGRDVLCGLGGNDVLVGFGGNDILLGGTGNDRLLGGAGKDILKGGSGRDELAGGAGNDRLDGGRGRDRLAGDAGADHLNGSYGNDFLVGGKGKDRVLGGPGKDRMRRDAHDAALGGPGRDQCLSAVVSVCP